MNKIQSPITNIFEHFINEFGLLQYMLVVIFPVHNMPN